MAKHHKFRRLESKKTPEKVNSIGLFSTKPVKKKFSRSVKSRKMNTVAVPKKRPQGRYTLNASSGTCMRKTKAYPPILRPRSTVIALPPVRVTQQHSGNLEYQQRAITAALQFVHIRRLGMLLLNQRGKPDMPMQGSDIF
jgi:hypothetical protein